ncbi:Ku protein [Streptomyces sp. NPDC005279]|uniref:Ku protein n=1 Tax=Streptomyces sp. NPDC005279 TaxID=3364712 RepID=UPI00368840CB
MRGVWSGIIQFGMVALPVRLYGATEEHAVRLHKIHAADGSRVEHRRFCRAEGREVPYEEVARLREARRHRGAAHRAGPGAPATADDHPQLTPTGSGAVPARTDG